MSDLLFSIHLLNIALKDLFTIVNLTDRNVEIYHADQIEYSYFCPTRSSSKLCIGKELANRLKDSHILIWIGDGYKVEVNKEMYAYPKSC